MSGRSDSLAHDVRAAVDAARLEARLDRTHGGDVDAWARGAGIESGKVIDFSASINPLGPPRAARQAFIKSYSEISRYPDAYGERLKEALARRHGLNSTEVLLGNGSTQLIYLLCAALRPRKALVISPAFSEYANALARGGAKVHQFTLTDANSFQFLSQQFMTAWDKDCDIAFFATPNSATGQLIPKTAIETIARAALTRKTFVVIDEAFIDFVEAESVKMLVRENPYVIVLRSLTKYFALPGLRLGYLLGETRRVAQFAACQEPWSVNAPALSVALACLKDTGFAVKTELWLEEERRFFLAGLASIEGLRPLPSRANFLLVKIAGNGIDALQLRSFLSRKKILIRACNSFLGLGGDYFRVAVKRRKDNLRLLAALREWTGPSSG